MSFYCQIELYKESNLNKKESKEGNCICQGREKEEKKSNKPIQASSSLFEFGSNKYQANEIAYYVKRMMRKSKYISKWISKDFSKTLREKVKEGPQRKMLLVIGAI